MVVEILVGLLALAAGLLIGWLLTRQRLQTVFHAERMQLTSERDVLQSRSELQARQYDEECRQYEQRLAELKTQYEERLESERKRGEQLMAEQRAQMKEQMSEQLTFIREQMTVASEKILHQRAEQLSATNREQLSGVIEPLKENIRLMREAVEKSDREQTITMERLDASIKENLRQAQQVGERADKLAQALTTENKTQGNFGELRLRQLLEQMGLEEGVQYEEQLTLRDADGSTRYDEEGHRLVPDVVLHFPDHRDVIIDSKVSLKAYQDYFEAETDAARAEALRRHVQSVRQHVQELMRKNYSQYIHEGRQRLDFVMMYVFSESALQLALTADPKLWREAYDQGVIIAGSQSLFIMLRVLEMTWKQVRQVENQQEIMNLANTLVDRVQLFYERFQHADELLHRTQESFDELRRSTAPSGMSITTAASRLLKFGAQENPKRRRRLPRNDEEPQA